VSGASDAEASAREIMKSYAKRWTIEPGFRDTKEAALPSYRRRVSTARSKAAPRNGRDDS
jgi:hypothetical protein